MYNVQAYFNADHRPTNGNIKKQQTHEEFKSCTATILTQNCILTTAACTGKLKNVNFFAKIGERQYGVNVSY